MTVVSPPKLRQIYWTAYSPAEGDSSPVDPLRFETYAERLGNVLFPGITSRVERVRYFGMVCAGLQTAGAEVGTRVTGREHTRQIRERFVQFEGAWAFAQVADRERGIKERPPGAARPRLRHEYRALRGANRALTFWDKTKDRDAVAVRGKYKLLMAQEAQGGLGSYLVALREHGFVHPDRLVVTHAGAELAAAFYDGTRSKTKAVLREDGVHNRGDWKLAGRRYGLPVPSGAERELVGEALFASDRTLGRTIARLPAPLRDPTQTHRAFEELAKSSDHDGSLARYVLAFDELRRTCLELFAQVGEALRQAAQPKRIVDLLPGDELAALAVDVQRAANLCAPLAVPDGLQPIAALAAELQACASTRVVPILIAFHRSEGRSWIEPVGADRLQLGHAGPFQRPSGFHGYTLNAAFSVHADLSVGQA